jgi:lantibiotic leader peptide-processing serine protease
MKKKISLNKKSAVLLALAMGVTTVSGLSFNAPSAHAAATGEKTYLVVFKNDTSLPVNYESQITMAGGKVKKSLKDLGTVEVTSSNANFALQMQSGSDVSTVGVENTMMPDVVQTEVATGLNADEGEAAASHDLYDQYGWDIKQVTGNGASWNMKGGTGEAADGKSIVVGIIDTGIDYNHPDIKNNYLYGKSFVPGISDPMDEMGHGTHVAGSIAGNGHILGVGPKLKLAAYRVFGPGGGAATADIANALKTAGDDNVDVVNMSLGGYNWMQDPSSTPKDVMADQMLFERAIAYATSKGVTVVGSAGNEGVDISKPGQLTKALFGPDAKGATFRTPSSPLMLRVASNGADLNRAWYSNYGFGMVNVSAPGGDFGAAWDANKDDYTLMDPDKRCFSTYPGGGYAWMMGTSMASPKAAALAGVIIAEYGKDMLTPAQVRTKIMSTATDINEPGYDKYSGYGLINAIKALQ